MALTYIGTRDRSIKATASEAILRGICPDGGLYIPEEIPKMEKSLEELGKLNYQELAYEVLSKFLDFTEEELKACIRGAYDEKFDTPEIVPVVKKGDALFLELFHGRTLAFKDMALSILPYLMKTAAKKNGLDKEIVILTATSGDTGKAALEGFANVEGTRIMVFFPEDGVSPVQKLQMNTQEGANTCVVGIKGNFDDAQSAVKSIFTDKALEQELAAKGFQHRQTGAADCILFLGIFAGGTHGRNQKRRGTEFYCADREFRGYSCRMVCHEDGAACGAFRLCLQ